ncbi:polysaccharide biosynthesis/export family protein [Chitinophaga vietnamensis]|uniref:polysaccharide biosynthesis/export family protein n=1 Tax=Chitinophaga vietnamensis TaxID=2593957 RepID=UPI001178BBB3|nr:polysaccharide biosynthesis/export family protein [Chitinophaga vietnamensis]
MFKSGTLSAILLLLGWLFVLMGCSSTGKLTYLNDIAARNGVDPVNHNEQLRIGPGDILQITVTTFDREVSQIFNPGTATMASSGNMANIDQGYLVDSSGYITMPVAGKILVKNKTTTAINDIVLTELKKTIKNVYVSTRLVNFRISVLGDVARPGSFHIGGERVSILDALSMAGDLNATAVRKDVMVIREIDGVKEYASLNLNNSEIFSSPYFFLTNNDVVYVKPGRGRKFQTSRTIQLLPAIISAMSLVTTIILLKK